MPLSPLIIRRPDISPERGALEEDLATVQPARSSSGSNGAGAGVSGGGCSVGNFLRARFTCGRAVPIAPPQGQEQDHPPADTSAPSHADDVGGMASGNAASPSRSRATAIPTSTSRLIPTPSLPPLTSSLSTSASTAFPSTLTTPVPPTPFLLADYQGAVSPSTIGSAEARAMPIGIPLSASPSPSGSNASTSMRKPFPHNADLLGSPSERSGTLSFGLPSPPAGLSIEAIAAAAGPVPAATSVVAPSPTIGHTTEPDRAAPTPTQLPLWSGYQHPPLDHERTAQTDPTYGASLIVPTHNAQFETSYERLARIRERLLLRRMQVGRIRAQEQLRDLEHEHQAGQERARERSRSREDYEHGFGLHSAGPSSRAGGVEVVSASDMEMEMDRENAMDGSAQMGSGRNVRQRISWDGDERSAPGQRGEVRYGEFVPLSHLSRRPTITLPASIPGAGIAGEIDIGRWTRTGNAALPSHSQVSSAQPTQATSSSSSSTLTTAPPGDPCPIGPVGERVGSLLGRGVSDAMNEMDVDGVGERSEEGSDEVNGEEEDDGAEEEAAEEQDDEEEDAVRSDTGAVLGARVQDGLYDNLEWHHLTQASYPFSRSAATSRARAVASTTTTDSSTSNPRTDEFARRYRQPPPAQSLVRDHPHRHSLNPTNSASASASSHDRLPLFAGGFGHSRRERQYNLDPVLTAVFTSASSAGDSGPGYVEYNPVMPAWSARDGDGTRMSDLRARLAGMDDPLTARGPLGRIWWDDWSTRTTTRGSEVRASAEGSARADSITHSTEAERVVVHRLSNGEAVYDVPGAYPQPAGMGWPLAGTAIPASTVQARAGSESVGADEGISGVDVWNRAMRNYRATSSATFSAESGLGAGSGGGMGMGQPVPSRGDLVGMSANNRLPPGSGPASTTAPGQPAWRPMALAGHDFGRQRAQWNLDAMAPSSGGTSAAPVPGMMGSALPGMGRPTSTGRDTSVPPLRRASRLFGESPGLVSPEIIRLPRAYQQPERRPPTATSSIGHEPPSASFASFGAGMQSTAIPRGTSRPAPMASTSTAAHSAFARTQGLDWPLSGVNPQSTSYAHTHTESPVATGAGAGVGLDSHPFLRRAEERRRMMRPDWAGGEVRMEDWDLLLAAAGPASASGSQILQDSAGSQSDSPDFAGHGAPGDDSRRDEPAASMQQPAGDGSRQSANRASYLAPNSLGRFDSSLTSHPGDRSNQAAIPAAQQTGAFGDLHIPPYQPYPTSRAQMHASYRSLFHPNSLTGMDRAEYELGQYGRVNILLGGMGGAPTNVPMTAANHQRVIPTQRRFPSASDATSQDTDVSNGATTAPPLPASFDPNGLHPFVLPASATPRSPPAPFSPEFARTIPAVAPNPPRPERSTDSVHPSILFASPATESNAIPAPNAHHTTSTLGSLFASYVHPGMGAVEKARFGELVRRVMPRLTGASRRAAAESVVRHVEFGQWDEIMGVNAIDGDSVSDGGTGTMNAGAAESAADPTSAPVSKVKVKRSSQCPYAQSATASTTMSGVDWWSEIKGLKKETTCSICHDDVSVSLFLHSSMWVARL